MLLKVSIGTNIQDGPWGGGNLFAVNLSRYLKNKGHDVIYDLDDRDIDIILLTEPRKTSPSSAYTNFEIQNYINYKIIPTKSRLIFWSTKTYILDSWFRIW